MSRAYDNSRRREEAARTRDRIVEAGCELARESDVRDWGGVTIAAVAERAGVSERTVYRHLGSEDGLRQAVMTTIERSAGIDLAGLDLAGVADAAALIFEQVAAFRSTAPTDLDPTLREAGERQRAALLGAVAKARPDWPADRQRALAAVLDVLWSPAAHERLVTGWNMAPTDATEILTDAIRLATTQETPADR